MMSSHVLTDILRVSFKSVALSLEHLFEFRESQAVWRSGNDKQEGTLYVR